MPPKKSKATGDKRKRNEKSPAAADDFKIDEPEVKPDVAADGPADGGEGNEEQGSASSEDQDDTDDDEGELATACNRRCDC